jgi:hypothetical protein
MSEIKDKVELGKYANSQLHDKLMVILQELSHHNPRLTYVATDSTWFGSSGPTVCEVGVLDGYQTIGRVRIKKRHHTNEVVYAVTSDNISSGNRNRQSHTKESKHLKEVMKVVKETFKPKSDDYQVENITQDVDRRAERLVSWARDHCRSAVTHSSIDVLEYLTNIHKGIVNTNELPISLTSKLGNNWETYVENYRIASSVQTQFQQGYGLAVRIERNGTINVVDLSSRTLSPCSSTYDLPTNYQEKITILKLVEEDQPIEHMGFRFSVNRRDNGVENNYMYFFLIAGETYTSC